MEQPKTSKVHEIEVPVLIIGGGLTGLLSAYMLSKLGVKSLLIEKYTERLAEPKAHALCPRSLEICRQFGLDTNQLRRYGSSREDAAWVNFVTNLSGERIGVLPYERMDVDVLNHTPEMIHNVPQPLFEQFLRQRLENEPNVTMQKGIAFTSCSQQREIVTSIVEERSTKTTFSIRSRHVLGCDKARSQVRTDLGIETRGEDGHETMMTIHFKANLRPVVRERVGMLHWIMDPACPGFIISYDLGDNHVLISNFDPKKHPAASWTVEHAERVVTAAIGQTIPIQVLSYRPWVFRRKVAKEYHKGNVYLVGDAAHSFPPTGGLGLNSGLADAHNLAYKIAAVEQGWARSAILDSYEVERRQIAFINSAQSVKNGRKIFSFLKALGTAGIEDIREARQNLQRVIHDPNQQGVIARRVEEQREHFDNLGIHIGYVYGSKGVPSHASYFTPKFEVGAQLPHAWIMPRKLKRFGHLQSVDVSYVREFFMEEVSKRQFSTLDLCSFDAFAMIASSRHVWLPKYLALRSAIKICNIKINLWIVKSDFVFAFQEQQDMFLEGSGLSHEGAILVRPDQHIVGRHEADTSTARLIACLYSHLGL